MLKGVVKNNGEFTICVCACVWKHHTVLCKHIQLWFVKQKQIRKKKKTNKEYLKSIFQCTHYNLSKVRGKKLNNGDLLAIRTRMIVTRRNKYNNWTARRLKEWTKKDSKKGPPGITLIPGVLECCAHELGCTQWGEIVSGFVTYLKALPKPNTNASINKAQGATVQPLIKNWLKN